VKKTLVGTVVLMAGLLALPQVGAAIAIPTGTITFNDLTDTVTVTTNSVVGTAGEPTCAGESCSLKLTPPAAATSFSSFEASTSPDILEPVTGAISDRFTTEFTTGPTPLGSIMITFTSNDESGLPGPVASTTLTEDGTIQTAYTIFFFSGALI